MTRPRLVHLRYGSHLIIVVSIALTFHNNRRVTALGDSGGRHRETATVSIHPAFVDCAARKLCRPWSGCILIFVDESVASGRSKDGDLGGRCRRRLVSRLGRSLLEGAVGPVLVVVRDVVGHEVFEFGVGSR